MKGRGRLHRLFRRWPTILLGACASRPGQRIRLSVPGGFPTLQHIVRERRNEQGTNAFEGLRASFFLAPRVGLEPTTQRLTAACSTS